MWAMEVLAVSIYKGTTYIAQCSCGVLAGAEAFMLEGQSLTPMKEDIYFLTGLSRRGEPINLRTSPPGPFNIEDYIRMYCEADIEKVGSQVSINKIASLSL
jgi:hypothetical protein